MNVGRWISWMIWEEHGELSSTFDGIGDVWKGTSIRGGMEALKDEKEEHIEVDLWDEMDGLLEVVWCGSNSIWTCWYEVELEGWTMCRGIKLEGGSTPICEDWEREWNEKCVSLNCTYLKITNFSVERL